MSPDQERYSKLKELIVQCEGWEKQVANDLRYLKSVMEPLEEQNVTFATVRHIASLVLIQSEILLMLAYPQLTELEDDS